MKQMKQMKQQSGFTLVELVTTMVIVGTLAAVAVPKFADAAKDARITKLQSLRNSVLSAAGSVHNTALSKSTIDLAGCPAESSVTATNSQAASGTVCTEGGVVSLVNGYPAAGTVGATSYTDTGIINVTGLTTKFRPSGDDLNKAGFGAAVNATTKVVTFSVIGGSGTSSGTGSTATTPQVNTSCAFNYTPTTTAGVPPAVTELDSTSTSGC